MVTEMVRMIDELMQFAKGQRRYGDQVGRAEELQRQVDLLTLERDTARSERATGAVERDAALRERDDARRDLGIFQALAQSVNNLVLYGHILQHGLDMAANNSVLLFTVDHDGMAQQHSPSGVASQDVDNLLQAVRNHVQPLPGPGACPRK